MALRAPRGVPARLTVTVCGLGMLALTALPAAAQVTLTGGGLQLVQEGGIAAEGNLALASVGAKAFALDDLGTAWPLPIHFMRDVNDGVYGNASSWIGGGATGSSGPFIGISLGAVPVDLASIAFGRSNVTSGDVCGGGVCTDRWQGLYSLQFTIVADPDASTPDANWFNIGTLNYGPAQPLGTSLYTQPWRRHRFNFDPIQATGIRLKVPATGIGGGTAIDEIELYSTHIPVQPPLPPPPGIIITPAPGFSIAWDGNQGEHFDAAAIAPVPDNLARATNGAVAFGSSRYPAPVHQIHHVNDGLYGNSNSWIADPGDPNPMIGVRFNASAAQPVAIDRIAWGRDNGNNVADACGGQCTDRSVGTYTLQVTRVDAPGIATPQTGDPATGWQTIGTVQYLSGNPDFRPHLRHEFAVAQNGQSILATGLRILVSSNALAIDEIEVYSGRSGDRPGDANRDGLVNRHDALILSRNYGRTEAGEWETADFSGDGAVGLVDFGLLQRNLDSPAPSASAVPEPHSLALAACATGILLVCRRANGRRFNRAGK
jgi:hypothetical protein